MALLASVGTSADLSPSPRLLYRQGVTAQDGPTRRAQHHAGVAAARAILSRTPDDPEGMLWLAANLGAEALAHSKLTALGVLPEMERTLLRLDQVAPTFEHAAAARTLARLYHKAPPLISIGSGRRARAFFERALTLAPNFPGNQAMAADFFQDSGEHRRALALARQVLAATQAAYLDEPDRAEWRAIAGGIVADSDGNGDDDSRGATLTPGTP